MYFNTCEQLLENTLFDLLEAGNLFNNFWYGNDFVPSMKIYSCSLRKQINNSDISSELKYNPRMNFNEDGENFYIHADLPGMTRDQIKIEFNEEDHSLIISGERKSPYETNQNEILSEQTSNNENTNENNNNKNSQNKENKENKENKDIKFLLKEINYGKFSKSFILPKDINLDNIQAKIENGLLKIIIPKFKSPKNGTRTIEIQ
ncbi:HSP20-like chaperone [Neocallimastix lanati (nom. inval.)]|nr:HSP20-like chaperone [Neocallimastix sp. JGI-2020a]KAG4104588.1 HSP20-like chaperone [Neocallimastix sp. JGI-2020a]